MSDLVYQKFNNRYQGWVNPSNLFFGPEIISLTGYQSPAGSKTVVSINGSNFSSYSVVRFGTFTPTVYFINSTLLSFYVPNTLTSGTYPVQVYNSSVCSNIVNYTIDMASGYWMLNDGGNTNTITNTNPNGVQVSWLSRKKPVYVFNTIPTSLSNPYIVDDSTNWIICDGNEGTSGPIYIKLPINTEYIGREITFKNLSNQFVYSVKDSNLNVNITELQSHSVSDTILTNTLGKWTTLVFDGNNWITMQCN